jgi:hypothetical protein
VADLEKGNHYVIRFGDDSIPAPIYDMTYFKDKIPKKPDVIGSGIRKDISGKRIAVTSAQKKKILAEAESTHLGDNLFKDKRVIWAAIGIVILLLGLMTMRMLKEMKAKEGE